MTNVIKAIQLIKPTAQVSVSNNDINTIVWENGETPISKADIEAKMNQMAMSLNNLIMHNKEEMLILI